MPSLTLGYGLFLIVWAALFSIGSASFTSWIPAFMGLPIAFSGFMARKSPEKKKLWMHVAVVFGLLCFLGGFRFFKAMFENPRAGASQLMLLVTGAVYTALCVRSFIQARKEQAAADDS